MGEEEEGAVLVRKGMWMWRKNQRQQIRVCDGVRLGIEDGEGCQGECFRGRKRGMKI
jgi:hypothetical protein